MSLLFIGSSSLLFAQSISESRSWIGIKSQLSLTERFKTSIGIQHRSKSDFKELDKYFLESTLDYDFSKEISLEIGLRLEKNNDTKGGQQGIENLYRVHADLNYKTSLGDYTFKSRVRFQINDQFNSQVEGRKTLRFKNSIEWKILQWKYDPEFLIEPFINLGDPLFSGVRKWRYGVQTDIPIASKQKLKIAYFYMTATQYLERHHIIGLFYKFDL